MNQCPRCEVRIPPFLNHAEGGLHCQLIASLRRQVTQPPRCHCGNTLKRAHGWCPADTWEPCDAYIELVIERATEAENKRLRGVLETLAEKVAQRINVFQDIVGWQPGESRNALIGEMAGKVEAFICEAAQAAEEKPCDSQSPSS